MIDLRGDVHSLIENFELMKGLLATYGPDSFQLLRERAFRSYSEFGIPTTKDEEFKYLSLRALEDGRFKPAYGAIVDRGQIEETVVGHVDAITVTFVNGEHAPELSSNHILPEGVFIGSLKDGLVSHEETIVRHLGSIATLSNKLGTSNDERFVHLNTAFLGEGAFVYLPRFVHHGFQCNSTEGPVFNFLTPAGFERLILDGGKVARYDEAPIPHDPASHDHLPSESALKKYGMRAFLPGSK